MIGHIDRHRLGVVSGGLLLALALARLLEAPARPYQITVLGSPLGFTLAESTVMMLILAGMAASGMDWLIRTHPRFRKGNVGRTVPFWIVPSLLVLALSAWLGGIENVGLWTLGLLAAALLVPLALTAEYASLSPDFRHHAGLRWLYGVLLHLVAMIALFVIYDARLRGLVAGPLVFLATALLSARLFSVLTGDLRAALLYGAVVGVLLAQLVWMINYWPLSGLQGGLLLLLAFYVLSGLLQQNLSGEFGRRVALEYAGVALVALAAILLAVN